ncbi:MAG: site-specific DNA-methyltransferase [Cytophagales bacterium]|nr:site-specific DNA-methyltransferase [Cytophagales bacterium]
MPTLNWIGKEKVVNHHRDVPFKVLEHQYGFTAGKGESPDSTDSGNMIIHGDNLEALKALLPKYEGKVNCIYIDPPYNTGNEGWVYNDNVNDPKILKWLGDVVGKEGEDLSRHDKWLCMMYPRIKLLHQLLAKDGAIFISIDDNEQGHLRLLCDEIFGGGNFLGNICWQKKQSPQNDAINFSDMHDFVLVYAKRTKQNRVDLNGFNRNLIPKSEKQLSRYKNPDNDPRGPWVSNDCTSNKTRNERPNLYYPITNPNSNIEIFPPETTVWRYDMITFNKLLKEDRIYFGKDGKSFPRLKLFLSDVADGVVPTTLWLRDFAGDNQLGRRVFRNIFKDIESDFSTPKPPLLISRILQIASTKNSIILDSFAGSGTTAQAVLELNKEDSGNRKFILIEMENYADHITAERVKRVINGYGEGNKAVEGTGGAFDYYQLGLPLFIGENKEFLNENVGVDKIKEYIWYSETRSSFDTRTNGHEFHLGDKNQTAYYFYYEVDKITTLDLDFLSGITSKAEQYIIYADNCLINKDFLASHNIVFKKIPRDISRF